MIKVIISIKEEETLLNINIDTFEDSGTDTEKFFGGKIKEVIEIMMSNSQLKNADPKSDIISQKKNSSKSPKQKIPAWGNSQKKRVKKNSGRSGK